TNGSINGSLQVGGKYILISTATDNAGNIQAPLPVSGTPGYSKVTYSPPAAVTAITNPQSLAYYNKLTNIQGTANGNTTQVSFTLQRNDAVDQCWGGNVTNGWISCAQSTATLAGAPSAGNWSFPFFPST